MLGVHRVQRVGMIYNEQSSDRAICSLIRLNQFIRVEIALFLPWNPPLYFVSDKTPNETESSSMKYENIYYWYFIILDSELSKSDKSESGTIISYKSAYHRRKLLNENYLLQYSECKRFGTEEQLDFM